MEKEQKEIEKEKSSFCKLLEETSNENEGQLDVISYDSY